MAGDRGRAGGAKSAAAQAKSRASNRSKTGARQGVSANSRSARAAKRWRPGAGALLRASMWQETDPAGIKLLVEQACRVADRLESLNRALHGDGNAMMSLGLGRVIADATPKAERKAFYVEVTLRVDPALAEEARQAKLLASLLSDITRQRAALKPAPPDNSKNASGRGDLDF